MLDSYGRSITYLRLSVTELCNLRCKYCMPESGVCKKRHEDMLSEEEMLAAIGSIEDNDFVKQVRREAEEESATLDALIEKLK